MSADTVVAICATAIAVASLTVSVIEGRASRRHNRLSVRPLLQLTTRFHPGDSAGLLLTNSGLGPAIIVKTALWLDGKHVGEYNQANVDKVRDPLAFRPSAVTFGGRPFLATDYSRFLLLVEPYDPDEHAEFADLLIRRLRVEIHYESLYGRENYTTSWPNRPSSGSA
ncbi:hypothetical protein J5X84_01980 [Streptosporangiaceae bacterium NEAU-GS5]|nr:hypothetical protein [Streptosporangiaceae bacterium NEAU-GS5]